MVLLHSNAASASDAIVCSFAITNTPRDVVRPNEGNASLRPAQRAGPVSGDAAAPQLATDGNLKAFGVFVRQQPHEPTSVIKSWPTKPKGPPVS